ncbi:zinc dependent phospholipase C family protein [Flavihumibacter petaseus]|uniref:S1/P1 Nuclease n=1 Tax=Flavihumibacter petaseus NBRC 106054 TaxID=1220578 RepID=A0A0E9MWG4_9BACT|nr:zinc dependent phospholipase C family protein [Flavihumibacter petaseus]GAO41858.1 hypothetical protein FPE01S_01_08730 [Flavihumibacter petaseus NBRC 106054]
MRYVLMMVICLGGSLPVFSWGFFAHRKINEYAVYLLPPELLILYKPSMSYIREHATDADKRRYILKAEAPRHYIDLDHYGKYPFDSLPRSWDSAAMVFGADSLQVHGILPWRIQQVYSGLIKAFREKNLPGILRLSSDLGHYIGDAHVPLHTSSNHNGQKTGQHGIHGFWESRVPELLADQEWDFFIGKAHYVENISDLTWRILLESAAAVDSVLDMEKALSAALPPDSRYAYEWRSGQVVKQYAAGYSRTYNKVLRGMIERRMRQAIQAVADCWYTAWVNAGQPDLRPLAKMLPSQPDSRLDSLAIFWRNRPAFGKSCN